MNKTLKYSLIGLGVVTALGLGYGIYNRATKPSGDNRNGDTGTGGGLFGGDTGGATSSVIGKSVSILPSEQYVNVRTSAKIDNFPPDNVLTRLWMNASEMPTKWSIMGVGTFFDDNVAIGSKPIGKIISTSQGTDGYTWYKISLAENEGLTGYVREDAVKLG